MSPQVFQIAIFIFVTGLIGYLTYRKCKQAIVSSDHSVTGENKEVFLAGGGLTWVFVAGSITLTNLSTDQLVGMNGNQMALLAWWEFSAVFGLIILAKVFLPIYYRYNCTTTTELLEKRYNSHHIRALIGVLFLLGNVFIFLPSVLYSGSLFIQTMFGIDPIPRDIEVVLFSIPIVMFEIDFSLMAIALGLAALGACYAVLGGLRAVAISDTYSGVLLLSLALVIVFLALKAINFDFTGIPAERLTLIGSDDSPIPWHTLLTGMIFIQVFYWSTNQTITQRAMASPTLEEGQKGVIVAAAIRFMIVPAIVVLPGIVSFKLYGDIGDAAYGRIVGDILPFWLSGMFAAALVAAVLTSFNSILNSSSALYVCDVHEKYFSDKANVPRLNAIVTVVFVLISLALVPIYGQAESIINLIQKLYGLLSMPILACFIVSLLFKDVDYRAAIFAVVFGVALYAVLSFYEPNGEGTQIIALHYIHLMFITLISSVVSALMFNKLFGNSAKFSWVLES